MQAILIETIAHRDQRYPTVGDYFTDERTGIRKLRISDMGNPDYEFLVALHELIESHLCAKHGIAESVITTFDLMFEARRAAGKVPLHAEPGDDPGAPYYHQHGFATLVEKMVARELGVDWNHYDQTVNGL
jgi:hypothetical protein